MYVCGDQGRVFPLGTGMGIGLISGTGTGIGTGTGCALGGGGTKKKANTYVDKIAQQDRIAKDTSMNELLVRYQRKLFSKHTDIVTSIALNRDNTDR